MGIHDGHREKMRRRFRETGLEGFADHEALELLLYYAIPRRDTNPIAHALMDRYDSLSAVLNAPVEDLQKVEGIGESAAVLLSLVARISRKARLADAAQEPVAIKASGISCVIAANFARIFYRNAINIGLAILECPAASAEIENGDEVTVDFDTGVITDVTKGRC